MDFRDYDTRLAAYCVVVDDEGRVLLSLWNGQDPPLWTLPGGGLELEETVEEGAVREVREETGYDVAPGRVLGVDSHVTPGPERMFPTDRPAKHVRVVLEGTVTGGELRPEVDGSTDDARWIPLAQVPSLDRVPLVDAALAMWERSGRGG